MLPDEATIKEDLIDVGDGHTLYAQEWGNKAGKPIVFLHGGPGSGCSNHAKQLFDPAYHRVIFFDQRGSGKSTPYGELKANTTDHLVQDISRIADHFAMQTFTLVGGSWGSCLALVYALRHPNRVERMVLRGIFTGRKKETDFLTKGHFKTFFPDIWDEFVESVPKEFREDPFAYHEERIKSGNEVSRKASAKAYAKVEGSVVKLDDRVSVVADEDFDPIPTLTELHYLVNGCFIEEGAIIKGAPSMTIPTTIIQGRYDVVCPPETAYELSKVLPNCHLIWTLAGHGGMDRANYEVVKTTLLN